MNLQNWVYQHHGNTGLYFTPLSGHTVTVDLNGDSDGMLDRSGVVVVGFMWGLTEHRVTRVWLDFGYFGVVEFNPGRIATCSDYELSDILVEVKV